MNVKTDKYVSLNVYGRYIDIKILADELLKDFIKEAGEFIDEVPDLGKVSLMEDILEYLDEKGIPYYYITPYDFSFIRDGVGVLTYRQKDKTIVIVNVHGDIETIGVLDGVYDPEDIVYMITRVGVYCEDNNLLVMLINEGYDYITIVLEDGTIVTNRDEGYNEILEKIVDCNNLEVSSVRV